MRDVQQQAPFGGQQRFNPVGHAVERARQLAQLVAAHALGAGGEIAAAEALHRLLQFAHRACEIQSQPVAEPHRGGHHVKVFRLQEPGANMGARHDEEEPEAAVIGLAGDRGIAGAEYLVEHPALRVADQV